MIEDFSTFHEALLNLVKSFEKRHVLVKLNSDPDSGIIRIYGEQFNVLALAKIGLEEIEELSLTTAEHHPYWNILYNGSQIIQIILEKWNDELTEAEVKEILWHIDEMKNSSSNVTSYSCNE